MYGIGGVYNSYSNYGIYNNYYKNLSHINSNNKSWQVNYQSALKKKYSAVIDETRDYAAALQKSAKGLQTSTKGDAFEEKSVISSRAGAVTGTKVSDDAVNRSYEIEISQVAAAQKNIGNSLKNDVISDFKTGKNEFSIISGDKTYSLNIDIKATDSNKMVLDKMASAINKADIGINVSVSNDKSSGTSRIELTGNKTGLGNGFILVASDDSDLLSKSGADKVNLMAQDAVYTVDNVQQTSDSNIVKLQDGKVEIELKEKTEGKVNISIGQDSEKVKKGINDFVKDYNTLVNSLQENSEMMNKSLLNRLTNILTGKKYDLQKIGISIGAAQTLTVDNDKLNKALQNDSASVQKIIGGYGGLAEKAEGLAKEIGKSSVAKLTGAYSGRTSSSSGVINNLALKNEQFKLYQQMSYYGKQNGLSNMLNISSSGNFFDWYF